ncbi:MAG: hypothetical protein AB1450_13275 [Pseudomonadota bacterium]
MAKTSRKEFLLDLERMADGLRAQIEAGVDGFKPDEAAREERRARSRQAFRNFARIYFPHYFSADVADSVFQSWAFERLHKLAWKRHVSAQEIAGVLRKVRRRGDKIALAAPRGEAKTTLLQVFCVYCIVFNLRRFIPIISDATEQAATILEGIKVELEANPRVAMDYPDATGAGRVWKVGVILTTNNIKLQAFGSGKRMRGLRHGPHRPDLVLIDDLENDENVATKAQRDKGENWIKRTVLKLGPPDDSLDVVYVGTILHYDSVLSRTLRNALWETKIFKALIQWPDRMDLWERWEELFLNDGRDAAEAFYAQHEKAMTAGAVVSWPDMRSLIVLMEIRARDGHESFASELQNDPTGGVSEFKLTYWVVPCRNWVFFGSCDPSLGKGQRSDYSALLVGGYDLEHGVLDVVEASIRRRPPQTIIHDAIEFQRQYEVIAWAFEAVAFQEFLMAELIDQSAQRGIHVPALPFPDYFTAQLDPSDRAARGRAALYRDKDLRILSLIPPVAAAKIRFNREHTLLNQQVEFWGKVDHDDGPDALQMLWVLARSGMGRPRNPNEYRSLGHRRSGARFGRRR